MPSKIEHTPARLKRRLRQLADPAVAASMRRFFKGPVRGLGVRTPAVRRLAAEAAKEYRRQKMVLEDVWGIASALWQDGVLEERVLAVFLIARFERGLEGRHWPRLESWAKSLSNWAETDGLCIYLLGPLLVREPGLAARLDRWTRSSNPLQRRAAAVALVPPARRGLLHEDAFRLCERQAEDEDELVRKALGWLLKELSRSQPERVVDFLLEHRGRLSRLTLRYASEKLPARLKRRLEGPA